MPEPNAQKVVFDEVQQKRVDELIRESMGRAAATVRLELATAQGQLTTLQTELQAAKDAAKEAETLRAEVARLNGDKSGLESSLSVKEKEAQAARDEAVAVRKQNIIQAAAAALGFFNVQQVAQLTDKDVQWNSARGKFIVVGEDGTERLGIDGNPLSVDAYYKTFAEKNPHLVRGDVKPGTGSREATQPPFKELDERQKLAKLFGKGADAVACNRLALSNPAEFKRQRYLAKHYGLI